jgi:phage tail sheath protein FI
MPEYLHPGVYVQELPSAVKPIEGVSTSTAGFVGVADRGPVPGFPMPIGEQPRPPLITSFAEFERVFGGFRADSYLAYAVQNFFDNGGRRAYVVRVVVTDDAPAGEATPDNTELAGVGLADRENAAQSTLAVVARSPGAWANTLGIDVAPATRDPGTRFKLIVRDQGAPVEAFDNLSMDRQDDDFADIVVNSRSQYVLVAATVPNGVSAADARPAETSEGNRLALEDGDGTGVLDVSSPVMMGGPLSVTTARSPANGEPTFRLTVLRGSEVLETFDGLSMNPGAGNFVERKINGRSAYIRVGLPTGVTITDFDASRPTDGTEAFPDSPLPAAIPYPPDSGAAGGDPYEGGAGADGRLPGEGDLHYLGNAATGTGLHAFDGIGDVSILAIPGQGNDLVISGGMAYCRNRPLQDAFFVADLGTLDPEDARTPGSVPDHNEPDDVRQFVTGLSTPTDYGAIYYPWIRVADPLGRGRNPTIALPPSGFIAGLYARVDNSRGVFKAPAGTETGLAGALGLCADVHDADQDSLNPIGLNAIRRFPVYGIVAWGTRTLSPDPAWRYIPVRRMAIYLRASIYRGIQWAVFEGNDEPLWAELRLNVRAFMMTQFRAGAFQGATPGDAFFVKCDASTTPQEQIDIGVVNILVGFAPLKPAEFVVLKLSQKVNQAAAA